MGKATTCMNVKVKQSVLTTTAAMKITRAIEN